VGFPHRQCIVHYSKMANVSIVLSDPLCFLVAKLWLFTISLCYSATTNLLIVQQMERNITTPQCASVSDTLLGVVPGITAFSMLSTSELLRITVISHKVATAVS